LNSCSTDAGKEAHVLANDSQYASPDSMRIQLNVVISLCAPADKKLGLAFCGLQFLLNSSRRMALALRKLPVLGLDVFP